MSLGYMYEAGMNVRQNEEQALNLYKKGCSLKEGSGCHNVAVMYYTARALQRIWIKPLYIIRKGVL